MTSSELQKIIDYIDENATKIAHEDYDEVSGNYVVTAHVNFNDLIELLAQYPIEDEKKCTASLNYEAEYNRVADELRKTQAELQEIELGNSRMTNRLARYHGAVAMAELIYGREIHM